MSTDDHLPSARNSPGYGDGHRQPSISRPEIWSSLHYAIDSSARTLRLITILIAFNSVFLVVIFLGRYAIDFFKSHSGPGTAIAVGLAGPALGSVIGLTVAYRRRRNDIQDLRELERAVESRQNAEKTTSIKPDVGSGDDGVTS